MTPCVQEHVTEYGVHWNFFFTLAAAASALAALPLYGARALAAACGLLSAYQIALFCGLAEWLQRDARDVSSFVDANREGLASLAGYVALAYLGCAAAPVVTLPQLKAARARSVLLPVGAAAAAWACTVCLNAFVQPVSRRFCNAAYVAWVAALSLTQLLTCACVEVAVGAIAVPRAAALPGVLRGWSERQLGIFLAANLSTGAVNLSMNTLAAPPAVAALVLCLHTGGLAALSGGLAKQDSTGKAHEQADARTDAACKQRSYPRAPTPSGHVRNDDADSACVLPRSKRPSGKFTANAIAVSALFLHIRYIKPRAPRPGRSHLCRV